MFVRVLEPQTGTLEADRDLALQRLQRVQGELAAAQRAQSAALAVQRQQAKGRERVGALERDLAAMVDKQVLEYGLAPLHRKREVMAIAPPAPAVATSRKRVEETVTMESSTYKAPPPER